MREADFQKSVIQLAKLLGWKVAHFGNTVKIVKKKGEYKTIADKGASGFPDLVMTRKDRLLFAELKLNSTTTTPAQDEWLIGLANCVKEVYIWRPRDWSNIEKILK